MGFGWMFLGYMLLLRSNLEFLGVPIDITPDFIGFLLMVKGLSTADRYCDCFRRTKLLGQIGIGLSAIVFLHDLLISASLLTPPQWLTKTLSLIYPFFLLIFTLFLLYSLYNISVQTGLEKTRKKAARCAIYTVLFFSFEQMGREMLTAFGASLPDGYMRMVELFFGALYIIINATLIFSCYMWICLEGDEDMPDRRKHKYKTPFDYFDAAKERDRAAGTGAHSTKKKKRK